MKKKRRCTHLLSTKVKKMLFVLQATVLLLLFCSVVQAMTDQPLISLSMKKATVKDVIWAIEKQSKLVFVYNTKDLDQEGTIDFDVKNKTVSEALDVCLKNTGLEYVIQQNTVVIRRKGGKTSNVQKLVLKGIVVDKDSVPLPGVTIVLKGTVLGVVSDHEGKFVLEIPQMDHPVLVFSFVGMQTQEYQYVGKSDIRIVMIEDVKSMEEVVVTGIFTRRAESFTGAAKTFRKDELKRVGNTNVFQSLKNLDPSLKILDNRNMGSDPNTLPDMRLRGTSSFPAGDNEINLKGNYQSQPNQPLFILDGFETTVETVFDLDMNRVESITILKDAASKAIYGSKAANGVVVIETVGLGVEGVRVTYTGNLDLEMPDLTSYNLCNAAEKLEAEFLEGSVYQNTYDGMSKYYERLKNVKDGLDEYWLSKPLQVGVGQKHALTFEMGNKEMKTLFTVSYNNVVGVMKESYRNTFSGTAQISYRKSNFLFRDIATITRNKTQDSPYGTFSEYAKANPYSPAYDENGKPMEYYDRGTYTAKSPLYNAYTNIKDQTSYLNFTNNFYIEWTIIEGLKATGRVSFTTKRSDADEYYPYNHTSQSNYGRDVYYKRGAYTLNTGKSNTVSGDIYLNFSRTWGKHTLFSNVGWNISENEYMEIINEAQGYKSDSMDEYIFGMMYKEDGKPSGNSSKNRNVGFLGVLAYTYADRFLLDATLRGSAASVFGTDNPWATFWSVGLGWNLHNEKFFKDLGFVEQFKIRGSIGYTGKQNFQSNKAAATYKYYMKENYNYYWSGAYLNNMENPGLQWELKKDYNVGVDLKVKNVSLMFDWYTSNTENLVSQITIPGSTGFTSVSENLGLIQNRGFEVALGINIINRKDFFLNVNGNITTNDNKLKKLSGAMKTFNDNQMALAQAEDRVTPVLMYYDGMHMNTLWAVPSVGIDPSDGYEVYINRDGRLTKQWKAEDMIAAGVADSKYNGNFGLNGEYKGFGLSVVFTFLGGGELYNQTLVDKVENVNITYNVDKRVLSGRWKQRGDQTQFRRIKNLGDDYIMGNMRESSYTRATTRFIQKDNELNLSSLSVYYDLPRSWMNRIGFERIRLQANMNDVYKWSSIKIERGTSYPFARTLSVSLTAIF